LVEQHGDEVGALVDRPSAGVGLMLVGGEPIREFANPLETKPWFLAWELFVGAPIVLLAVLG
jgi:hypothetical protein